MASPGTSCSTKRDAGHRPSSVGAGIARTSKIRLDQDYAMPDIRTEKLNISVSDGTEMGAYAAYPLGEEPRPGLIVLQEAFGVNAHIRDMVGRFALQGYAAIAP